MLAEFNLIAEIFAPLAKDFPGALGLLDDAAIIRPRAGRDMVFTKDLMVSGVHFPEGESPEFVGRKLLRVNLSDLAAMGAEPVGYGLGVAFPEHIDESWLRAFASGLAKDQELFGISLMGGDTVATPGPITLSLTALGDLPAGQALKRSSARAGDLIMVSGTVGDGTLGLRAVLGELTGLSGINRAYLLDRLRLPQPRLTLGQGLRGVARAAVDISDGLVADLGHICNASGLGASVHVDKIPLSGAATELLGAGGVDLLPALLTGGDDYELLFTVAPEDRDRVVALGARLNVPITEIGRMVEGESVTVLDSHDVPLAFQQSGYRHF
ncbi:MAG: thiamine-phosphate kinase [Rhodospirillales bacterium]|nr:thiamine-phosphate kinase [Rhodospirillales bacterium]